jgi:hypothetical protein
MLTGWMYVTYLNHVLWFLFLLISNLNPVFCNRIFIFSVSVKDALSLLDESGLNDLEDSGTSRAFTPSVGGHMLKSNSN